MSHTNCIHADMMSIKPQSHRIRRDYYGIQRSISDGRVIEFHRNIVHVPWPDRAQPQNGGCLGTGTSQKKKILGTDITRKKEDLKNWSFEAYSVLIISDAYMYM